MVEGFSHYANTTHRVERTPFSLDTNSSASPTNFDSLAALSEDGSDSAFSVALKISDGDIDGFKSTSVLV